MKYLLCCVYKQFSINSGLPLQKHNKNKSGPNLSISTPLDKKYYEKVFELIKQDHFLTNNIYFTPIFFISLVNLS